MRIKRDTYPNIGVLFQKIILFPHRKQTSAKRVGSPVTVDCDKGIDWPSAEIIANSRRTTNRYFMEGLKNYERQIMDLAINRKGDSSKISKIWKKFLRWRFSVSQECRKGNDRDRNVTQERKEAKSHGEADQTSTESKPSQFWYRMETTI